MGLFDDLPTARRGGLFDGLPNAEPRVSTGLFDDIPADSRTPTRGANRRGNRRKRETAEEAFARREEARQLEELKVQMSEEGQIGVWGTDGKLRESRKASRFDRDLNIEDAAGPLVNLAPQAAAGVLRAGAVTAGTAADVLNQPLYDEEALLFGPNTAPASSRGVAAPVADQTRYSRMGADYAQALQEHVDERYPMPAARQRMQSRIADNPSFMGTVGAILDEPVGALQEAAYQLGQFGPVARAFGVMAGAALITGGQGGAGAADDFDAEWRAGVIQKSPAFQKLAEEIGPDQAYLRLKGERIQRSVLAQGGVGAATAGLSSKLGGNFVDDLLAGKMAAGSVGKKVAGEIATESLIEEPADVLTGNVVARSTGSDRDVTEGLGSAVAQAALTTAPIAGAFAAPEVVEGYRVRRVLTDPEIDPSLAEDQARRAGQIDIWGSTNEGLSTLGEFDRARRSNETATRIVEAAPTPAAVEGVDLAAGAFDRARSARRAEVRQPLPTAGAAIAPTLPAGTQLRSAGRMRQEIPAWGSRQPQQVETTISPPAIQPSAMPEGRPLAQMTADEQRAELDQRLADRGISMRAQQDAAEEGARPTVDFYREPDEQIARSSSGMIDFNWDAEEADAPAPVRTGPEPPEFSPTGRQYGQAPDDALPDWAPPEGRRLDVRRAEAGELADAFLGIAGAGQAAFQLPQVPEEARTIEDIASAVDPQVRIARGRVESVRGKYPNAREVYSITMRDGTSARFVVEEDGGTQLNASALEEGKSGGAALYAIVNTFAQRNGLKALPDREGLSEINKTRRTEQQAASALRTGSTQHLATDITQRVAGFERGGEDRANTGALLMKGYANTVSALPEIHQLRYNFDSGQFEWTNGEIADDADFDRLAASDPAREIGAGRSTVKRAVLAASVLREVRRRGVGSGKVLGDAGRQQLQQLAAPALERIFYARDGVDGAGGQDRGGRPAVAQEQRADRGAAATGRAAARPVGGERAAAPRNPARTAATVWGELASGLGQRMARRLRAQPWLFVLNNRAELRTNKDLARWASQLSPSEMVGGFYTPSGDVVLIADEMVEFDADGRPVDVAATAIALHEIGVHYGLKGLLGGDFQRVLEEFAGLEATDPKVAAAFARIPRDTPQDQRREEALAYYIQQNFDQPVALMDRVMAAITRFLRRFGSDRQYTPDQLRALVRGATEKASRGQLRERFAERNDTAEAREAEALAFSRRTPDWDRFATLGGLANAFTLAKGKTFQTGRDLKLALQNAMTAATNPFRLDLSVETPETVRHLTRMAVADARYALQSNANAVGWYDTKVSQALAALALVHPEIATSEEAEFAFIFALAVTSNGLKVNKNFELAEQAYRSWRDTGAMPTDIGVGTAAKAINDGLTLFNDRTRTPGSWRGFRDFMISETTVKAINALGGDVSGEKADTVVRGAAIIGPKIGNGFFSNLYGFFDALTMDRWLMRTWGRWTGNLIEYDAEAVARKKQQLSALLGMLTPQDRKRFLSIVGARASWSPAQIAEAILEASETADVREQMNEIAPLTEGDQARLAELLGKAKANQPRTSLGSELRKLGNRLSRAIDGQKEAPANGSERNFIRRVFGAALQELQQDYPRLTMADLQALLWYPEKRLYESAKQKDAAAEDEGYNDDEAPDYANAAAALARTAGVPQSRISEAFSEAAKRTRAGGRGDRGGRTAQLPAAGRDEGVAKSSAKRLFLGAPVARLLFEVAPDPNNAELKARWDALSPAAKARASLSIAEQIAPKALTQARAARAQVQSQIGGYLDDSNPSLALLFGSRADLGRAVQAARVLGFALSQDSMMVLASKPFEGSFETGLITVLLPEGQTDQDAVHQTYMRLRALDPESVQGHTTVGREMVLAVPADAAERLAREASRELASGFAVYHETGHMAFPSKEEYDYGDVRGQAASELPDGGQGARDLRAEASRLLEQAFRDGDVGRRRDVGRSDAAGGRLGPAQQAELTRPSFSARKPQKDAVAAVGVHYSPVAGLTSLDPTFAGTAYAGRERYRFGPGRFGRDNPRLNFYVQDGNTQPGKERALADARNGYTVTLENLYDYAEDPRGIVAENHPNVDAIEEEVADAGFDGLLFPPVAGIPNRTAVVFGFKKKVPVAPVEDAGFFGDERISKSSSAAEQPRDELGRFAPTGTPPAPRPKPDKRFSTSTKNEYTNEERELLAKDPVFSALPSRAHEDLVLDALAKLKRNPRAAEDVAAELAAGLIDTVSEEQEALLLVGKIQLMRERAKVAQRAFDRRYTESNRAGAMQEWDEVEARITQLDIANRTAGAIWARTGHLRQRVLREDFSFDTMAERLARSLGRPLTVEEGREIDQMAKGIRQRDLALAAAEERAREAEDLADSQRMLVEMVEQTAAFLTGEVKARSRPLLALVRKMAAESRAALARMDERKVGVNRPSQRKQGGAVDVPRIFHITRIGMAELVEMGYRGADWTQAKTHEWRVRMRKALGPRRFRYNEDIMPGILKQARADLDKINATAEERVRASVENAAEYGLTHADVYELVEALVASGMTDEAAVMAEATRRLQEVQPGITSRDVRRLFTDYGRARFPSTDAVKKRTRELRELQRLQESIDRLEEGMPALKTGQQRDKASATVRERRRRLNELLRIEELKGAADPVRLATFQDARISNLRNLIADLKRMLETGERPISIPAPPPTDEAKQLMQEVSDLRKKIREADQAGGSRAKERALKQMRDREAMLARRLEALQQQVLKGERAPARPKTSGAKSPIELQIANLEAQLRAIERAKKPQLSRAEKVNKARLSALEREERILTEELLTGLRRPPGSPVAPTAEVEAKAAAVRALREQARELRAASVTPEQAEQNYQLGVSKLLAREIKRIEARMAAGDFTKKPRAAKRMLSAENLQTQLELRKLKHAFAKRVFDAEMAKRTRIQKGFGLVVETFNATRSIMTSIDWSAILRQSLFTFGHPVLAAKVFKPMFLATFSEAQNVNIEEQIRKRPNYQLYERAKLHLTESHGYDPKRVEEQFVGRWLERIEEVDGEAGKNLARKVHRWATAPVRGSGRAYSTFTNLMRVEMFDTLYGSLVNDPTAPAQAELEAVANLVNVFTGRGTFGKTVDAGGVAASMLLFAPRYLASRFNVLLGQPILRGYLASEPGTNKRIARMAAKEYARTLVGMAAIYGLAAMWQAVNGDDDDEEPIATLDPRSSDFGKIKFGNVYLDPMAGLAQATVFMARVWAKETTVDGEVRSLGPDRDFGQRSVYDVMADFGRSKLSPMSGFIVNSLTDEGFGGEPLTNIEAAQELVAPLAWREVPGVVKDQGLPEGMALMTLSWLGMGIQYRDPDRWDEIKEKRADYREERGR
jgi:hypothetical protein